ncbi:ABC transporter ATP-binding protein [Granulicella sibirica]|uniref:ABC transporter ATP-binding protein n=1 Tax=Granulicella sibirica TaxID=2479048 RepID=UPI0019D4FC8D|nr:ABC transporter ATP-binding protein [Granulicella sibirica]
MGEEWSHSPPALAALVVFNKYEGIRDDKPGALLKTKSDTVAAPASPIPLLAFEHASKRYTNADELVRALDDVSLEIGSGRFVALMGRSGCGKSTLLHLAGALDFPTSGRVWLDGIATDTLDEAGLTRLRREKIGFVFQSFQLLNTLSVLENVEVPLLLAGERKAHHKAMARLSDVGLADYAHRMIHQLSGGQMQRVAIARALVHDPRIVLADEPTGNLDTSTGNVILELLQRICSQQQVTVLMATHSTEASSVADTIVHMRDGRVVSEGENVEERP